MSPANIEGAVKVACPLAGSAVAIGDDRPYVVALFTLDPDVAAAFAAAHPSRVSHLVLYGAFAHGEEIAPASARQAMLDAVAGHWGLGSRLLADVFVPGASSAERDQFAADVRTMAASLLRQDEHRGVRRLLRKVVGK
jgi:pimeloyl-ACP methyl ester carboxylesterase